MLVIRLFRIGKKNQPSFKIVVTDKRNSSTRGRFVEEVGFWNPLKKEKVLKQERIKYWISVGAQPSNTIHNLLVSEKIIEGKKIDVHKKPKAKAASPEGMTEVRPQSIPQPAAPTEAAKEPASLPAEASAKAGAPAGATADKEPPKEEVPPAAQ